MNSHRAVIEFSGDPDGEHPDPELRGQSPLMTLIASGDEIFCWQQLRKYTQNHPLRTWEKGFILAVAYGSWPSCD